MIFSSVILAAGIVWGGIVPENRLGGRPASNGYLQGKVFLVDCRDYSQDKASIERMEDFWQSYKIKSFVMVGSHRGGSVEAVKRNLEAAGVSYPVYADVVFESKTFEPENGLIYVIDQSGKMAIKTRDMNRAFEAAVSAMSWGGAPSSVKHFCKLIDYELEVLPGKAHNHILAMRKQFPAEAAKYDEVFEKLDGDEEVKKVAKLEEVARRVKDFDSKTGRNGGPAKLSKEKIETLIVNVEPLKKSENPMIAQETKNCIADLKWALAAM